MGFSLLLAPPHCLLWRCAVTRWCHDPVVATTVLLSAGAVAGGGFRKTRQQPVDHSRPAAAFQPRPTRPTAAVAAAAVPPRLPLPARPREEPRQHAPASSRFPAAAPPRGVATTKDTPLVFRPQAPPILPDSTDAFGIGSRAAPYGLWQDASELVAQAAPAAALATAMRDLAFNSVAAASQERYLRVFESFVDFCVRMKIPGPYMPAAPAKIGLFLTHLVQAGQYGSSFNVAVAALRWAHLLSGRPNPFDEDASLSLILAGARRTTARPEHRRPHLTLHDYHRALDACLMGEDQRYLQLALMLAISFGAALRFSELIRLTWTDIHIRPTHLLVLAKRMKVRADGTPDPCPLPASGDAHCPVALAVAYASIFNVTLPYNSRATLWPNVPPPEEPMDWDTRVSDDYCYQALRSLLTSIGLSGEEFSWHSSRAGAATAADEAGLGEHAIAAMGGWSSKAVQTYMRVTEDSRLTAAATMMGLPPPPPHRRSAQADAAPHAPAPLPPRPRKRKAPTEARPRQRKDPHASAATTLLASFEWGPPAAAPSPRVIQFPQWQPSGLLARVIPPAISPPRPRAAPGPPLAVWLPPERLPGPQAPAPTSSAFPPSRFASSQHRLV